MMMSSLKNAADIQQKGSCGTSRGEAGNVLFLILIAVALFAALSYAVTQSTRSGGGDASSETNLVNSAQITQYPAGIKTAITRMIISNSVDPAELEFNAPADFTASGPLGVALTSEQVGVFHPNGGGAVYALAPDSVVDTAINPTKEWVFNSENEIYNIGTDGAPSASSADIIAFLPGVKQSICTSIHNKLGLSTTFEAETTIDYATQMDSSNTGIGAGGGIIGDAGGSTLNGQPQGCFLDGTTYVYFGVLVER